MPFGFNNALVIFSRIVVSSFKYFMHKFLEVYFDDWTMFGLVRGHIESLHMMLGRCLHYHFVLNLKKCIFCASFGVLLGHVVCRNGILVEPAKFVIILDLPPLTSVTQVKSMLRHTWYYMNFIWGYADITAPMGKLIKKDVKFQWTKPCQERLDKLNNKMATAPILVLP